MAAVGPAGRPRGVMGERRSFCFVRITRVLLRKRREVAGVTQPATSPIGRESLAIFSIAAAARG
jgi:hypothetical protein